jgi:hypothetical protein
MPLFEKLRVSLDRAFDAPLIEELGEDEYLPRAEYLRRAFAEERRFMKKDEVFTFHPLDAPDGFAAGFFARGLQVSLRHEDLSPYTAENYEPALFLLSLDRDQVVWMEDKATVGSPKPILESFFTHLLRKTDLKDWVAFVRYFERQETFWDVVRTHRHRITKVILKFVPPNAFEGSELAQEFYTQLQKEVNNDVLEQTLKAKAGKMKLNGPMMQASAEIAEQGAGERELRGPKNELLYSSSEGKVVEKVAEEEMPTVQSPGYVSRVIRKLFGIDP